VMRVPALGRPVPCALALYDRGQLGANRSRNWPRS
jgi:hypothetical protein